MLFIGIDAGTHTGYAEWDGKEFTFIKTLPIHLALERVTKQASEQEVVVVLEDARLRKWYGARSNAKMQGAGSIKRDCSIWEDFCKEKKIRLLKVHPLKGMTKLSEESFRYITGYEGKTSEHSRDAGMLVYGR